MADDTIKAAMASPEVARAARDLFDGMMRQLAQQEQEHHKNFPKSPLKCKKCEREYVPQVHVMPLSDASRALPEQFTIIPMFDLPDEVGAYLVTYNITKFENWGVELDGRVVAMRRAQAHVCSDKCFYDMRKGFGESVGMAEGWHGS